MVNGNIVGFGMFILAALFILVGRFVIGIPDAGTMILAGLILVGADLGLRLSKRHEARWLMGQSLGGYLFFAPVWIFGIAVVVLNLINSLLVKR